jgi:Mor family transcriptional regulator
MLVALFKAGAIIKNLARQYAVSESSVKRLLRARGAKRWG